MIAYSDTDTGNKRYYSSATNSTYSSWDDPDYETQLNCVYYGNYPESIKEPVTKWHAFCYWLNKILDPPEEPVIPPEEPPPKNPKVILYFNVKLARAPPWLFCIM